MKTIVIRQFSQFNPQDFSPRQGIKSAVIPMLGWGGMAFLFVLLTGLYAPENTYYQEAIGQGIGAKFWNVIGSFGLFFYGLVIAFPGSSSLAALAQTVLSGTYVTGLVSLGLLSGQWSLLVYREDWGWWHSSLFSAVVLVLLVVIFMINFSTWYFSFLVRGNGTGCSVFLSKLSAVHGLIRIPMGIAISLLITGFFLLES